VLDVQGWAELRREHFVRGVCIKELARRTGLSRNTIRAALRSSAPPKYSRPAAPIRSRTRSIGCSRPVNVHTTVCPGGAIRGQLG
jgi:lambda repressor-like predicted transcriptional regulator